MNEFYKSMFDPKGRFGIWGIVVLIILGVSFMLIPGMFLDKQDSLTSVESPREISEEKISTSSSLIRLEENLASQINNILSEVEGVGDISVAVSLASGQEQDYARDVNNQKVIIEENDTEGGVRVTTESDEKTEYVLVRSRNEPLIVKEKAPQIKGVLVVAEGAKNTEIKIQLSKAVQSLFDLPAHRIMILPKEGR